VAAFATVLLTHVSAFDRFDEILYLVEKAADLTLTDSRPLPHPISAARSEVVQRSIYETSGPARGRMRQIAIRVTEASG
jgi:hypothetical protein